MADSFGANPQMAGQVSRELAAIQADLESLGRMFDGYDGGTGSARVEAALDEFFAESSDSRGNMGKLLERASGLLRGLAEGTAAIDSGLATTLEPAERQQPSAGPEPSPEPSSVGGR